MSYYDFFCLPLKSGKEQEYKKIAQVFMAVMKDQGLISYCESVADDVPRGKVTDFYRAVAADDNESVVAAYCKWPDKATRDKAWEVMMSDSRLASMNKDDLPFDGKRMFWGGFKPLVEL